MALRTYKPTTKSLRGLVIVDREGLWKGKPVKALTQGIKSSDGRDNYGHMTSRFRGGGHKRSYRVIDFKRNKFDIEGKVERIEYDPNRSAYIALITYTDGVQSYIIAPQRVKAGDTIIAGEKVEANPGNAMPIKNIPLGTLIHNLELKPGRGAQLARSAGSYVQLIGKDSGYALVRLRSGEVRKINGECIATVGSVSNPDHQNIKIGKAGRSRWLGRKPHNRGVSMNPVDHPLGGGEGKTSGGRHPVSPWGQKAKGLKTRKNKSTDKYIVADRRKKLGEGK